MLILKEWNEDDELPLDSNLIVTFAQRNVAKIEGFMAFNLNGGNV